MPSPTRLNNKTSFYLRPTSPFHFDGTFHKPSHFPSPLDAWQPGIRWQTIRINRRVFGLKIENKPPTPKRRPTQKRRPPARPRLRVTVFHSKKITPAEIAAIKSEITWRFGIIEDLREFNKLARKDKRFYPIFKKWLGMRSSNAHGLYGLIIISILLQNATVRRSVSMLETLLKKYGSKIIFDSHELFEFWLPQKMASVPERELRALKIGYRAKFIKKLSQDFAKGKIDELAIRKLDKDAAKEELIKLYGIGPESARILLFESFRHNDTFDHIAPWQQKIYSRLFYNKPRVAVRKIQSDLQRRYKQFTMLAVHYIWEDIFWRRRHESIPWLEKEIRL